MKSLIITLIFLTSFRAFALPFCHQKIFSLTDSKLNSAVFEFHRDAYRNLSPRDLYFALRAKLEKGQEVSVEEMMAFFSHFSGVSYGEVSRIIYEGTKREQKHFVKKVINIERLKSNLRFMHLPRYKLMDDLEYFMTSFYEVLLEQNSSHNRWPIFSWPTKYAKERVYSIANLDAALGVFFIESSKQKGFARFPQLKVKDKSSRGFVHNFLAEFFVPVLFRNLNRRVFPNETRYQEMANDQIVIRHSQMIENVNWTDSVKLREQQLQRFEKLRKALKTQWYVSNTWKAVFVGAIGFITYWLQDMDEKVDQHETRVNQTLHYLSLIEVQSAIKNTERKIKGANRGLETVISRDPNSSHIEYYNNLITDLNEELAFLRDEEKRLIGKYESEFEKK